MDKSKLKTYSIGQVAENKALNSKEIQVIPIEAMTMLDGEAKSNPGFMEDSGIDSKGTSYASKTIVDNVLTATWLPVSSNRMTAPDVRRGERVLIWQYADADEYYWTDLGWDYHLRKKETVRWAISATEDENETEFNPENCYYVEVSSHNQTITLSTTKKLGEPFAYTFQFNLKAGVVVLSDDAGNYIEFDSKETQILLHNMEGTEISLDKRNILMKCLGMLKATATQGISLQAPIVDASGDVKIGGNIEWGGTAKGDGSGVSNTIPVD